MELSNEELRKKAEGVLSEAMEIVGHLITHTQHVCNEKNLNMDGVMSLLTGIMLEANKNGIARKQARGDPKTATFLIQLQSLGQDAMREAMSNQLKRENGNEK